MENGDTFLALAVLMALCAVVMRRGQYDGWPVIASFAAIAALIGVASRVLV